MPSLPSTLTLLTALLLASTTSTRAQGFTLSGGPISGSNENGIATFNGYTCSGAIYVGCDNDVNNAICCVGARAQQNICNGGQPTTCTEGSQVPLTAAGTVAASATGESASSGGEMTMSANGSGSESGAAAASSSAMSGTRSTAAAANSATSSGASSSSSGAAPSMGLQKQVGAAGALAVVVKVLFL